MIDLDYPKLYRKQFGYTNQTDMKNFLAAKDIKPNIDFYYIDFLNQRLFEIVDKLNEVVSDTIRITNIKNFTNEYKTKIYKELKNKELIQQLNNQGRRPEEVYFSWMRGNIITKYFIRSLCDIFNCNESDITEIGDDKILNKELFKRTPKADLQIKLNEKDILLIEMQAGFQGTNDVKQHKILEAKRKKRENNNSTIIIHFDLYNGQVAFLKADEVEDNDVNWITRQQMEGQTVFNIDQNKFLWKLTETPPKYTEMEL